MFIKLLKNEMRDEMIINTDRINNAVKTDTGGKLMTKDGFISLSPEEYESIKEILLNLHKAHNPLTRPSEIK